MPRTFSLKRLLIGVTVVAVGCGFAVNYPRDAFDLALIASFFVPSLLVAAFLSQFSAARWLTFSLSLLAPCICGVGMAPWVLVVGYDANFWWRKGGLYYGLVAILLASVGLFVGSFVLAFTLKGQKPPLDTGQSGSPPNH